MITQLPSDYEMQIASECLSCRVARAIFTSESNLGIQQSTIGACYDVNTALFLPLRTMAQLQTRTHRDTNTDFKRNSSSSWRGLLDHIPGRHPTPTHQHIIHYTDTTSGTRAISRCSSAHKLSRNFIAIADVVGGWLRNFCTLDSHAGDRFENPHVAVDSPRSEL